MRFPKRYLSTPPLEPELSPLLRHSPSHEPSNREQKMANFLPPRLRTQTYFRRGDKRQPEIRLRSQAISPLDSTEFANLTAARTTLSYILLASSFFTLVVHLWARKPSILIARADAVVTHRVEDLACFYWNQHVKFSENVQMFLKAKL